MSKGGLQNRGQDDQNGKGYRGGEFPNDTQFISY